MSGFSTIKNRNKWAEFPRYRAAVLCVDTAELTGQRCLDRRASVYSASISTATQRSWSWCDMMWKKAGWMCSTLMVPLLTNQQDTSLQVCPGMAMSRQKYVNTIRWISMEFWCRHLWSIEDEHWLWWKMLTYGVKYGVKYLIIWWMDGQSSAPLHECLSGVTVWKCALLSEHLNNYHISSFSMAASFSPCLQVWPAINTFVFQHITITITKPWLWERID